MRYSELVTLLTLYGYTLNPTRSKLMLRKPRASSKYFENTKGDVIYAYQLRSRKYTLKDSVVISAIHKDNLDLNINSPLQDMGELIHWLTL